MWFLLVELVTPRYPACTGPELSHSRPPDLLSPQRTAAAPDSSARGSPGVECWGVCWLEAGRCSCRGSFRNPRPVEVVMCCFFCWVVWWSTSRNMELQLIAQKGAPPSSAHLEELEWNFSSGGNL